MEGVYNSREYSAKFCYLVQKSLSKNNNASVRGLLEIGCKCWKILEKETLCRNIHAKQQLLNNFHWAQKFKKATCILLRICIKNEEKIQEPYV